MSALDVYSTLLLALVVNARYGAIFDACNLAVTEADTILFRRKPVFDPNVVERELAIDIGA